MPSMISICIPTFNGGKFLQEALDSIKQQTYKNIEVIISDDNSVDSTLDICQEFKNSVCFPVHIFSHVPQGIGANWNNCIRKSKGDYIKFLFQDDILLPNCLEIQLNLLTKYNGYVVTNSRYIIDDTSCHITSGKWYEEFGDLQKNLNYKSNTYLFGKRDLKKIRNLTHNYFGEPDTFLFKRSIFDNIGYFNESFSQLLDLEFSYRILGKYDILIDSEKMLKFRIHKAQASFTNLGATLDEYKILSDWVMRRFYLYLPFNITIPKIIRSSKFLSFIYNFLNRRNS